MNKKLVLLTALVMLSLLGISKADMRATPNGSGAALATADYGGVNYTTGTSLASTAVQCFKGGGVFQGLFVSSFAG